MAVNSNAVLNFFASRLKLFAQIVRTKNPEQINKTEQGFLAACLQYLPSVGRLTPETSSKILELLEEVPGMEMMTKKTKDTVIESVLNVTDQAEPGCAHRQSFAVPEPPTTGGKAKPSSAAGPILHPPVTAQPDPAAAAAQPGPESGKLLPKGICIDLIDDD